MKLKVTKHGKYMGDTLNSIAPIVICPECGQEIKRVKVKEEKDSTIYGYRIRRSINVICPNCQCKFEGEEYGDKIVEVENILAIIGVALLIIGFIVLVVGAIFNSVLAIYGFIGCILGPAFIGAAIEKI